MPGPINIQVFPERWIGSLFIAPLLTSIVAGLFHGFYYRDFNAKDNSYSLFSLDMHSWFGFSAAVLGFVLSVSGAFFCFTDWLGGRLYGLKSAWLFAALCHVWLAGSSIGIEAFMMDKAEESKGHAFFFLAFGFTVASVLFISICQSLLCVAPTAHADGTRRPVRELLVLAGLVLLAILIGMGYLHIRNDIGYTDKIIVTSTPGATYVVDVTFKLWSVQGGLGFAAIGISIIASLLGIVLACTGWWHILPLKLLHSLLGSIGISFLGALSAVWMLTEWFNRFPNTEFVTEGALSYVAALLLLLQLLVANPGPPGLHQTPAYEPIP